MTKQSLVRKNNFLFTLLAASSLLLSTGISSVKAQSKPLKVGVVVGVYPCSDYDSGQWKGIAVELWDKVAKKTQQTYTLVREKTTENLLEDTKQGNVDVGIGCVSLSPKRVRQNEFTDPFKEDGISVLTKFESLDFAQAFLVALFSPYFVGLFIGFIIAMSIFAFVLDLIHKRNTFSIKLKSKDERRQLSKYLLAMIIGGELTNFSDTTRGNTLLVLAHFTRLVFASLIVSYITVNVVNQNQQHSNKIIVTPSDLAGLKVAVRSGSISENLLKDTNKELIKHGQLSIVMVSADSLQKALDLLLESKVYAMIGNTAQLQYLKRNSKFSSSLAMQMPDTMVLSQGFAISPNLPIQTKTDINTAIAELQIKGDVQAISKEWLGEEKKIK